MHVHHPELKMKPKLWKFYPIAKRYNYAQANSHQQQPFSQWKQTGNKEICQSTEGTRTENIVYSIIGIL